MPQMHVENQFIPSKGHPLQTNWKFWYVQRFFTQPKDAQHNSAGELGAQPQTKFKDYRERLKDMGIISTIEQFF